MTSYTAVVEFLYGMSKVQGSEWGSSLFLLEVPFSDGRALPPLRIDQSREGNSLRRLRQKPPRSISSDPRPRKALPLFHAPFQIYPFPRDRTAELKNNPLLK